MPALLAYLIALCLLIGGGYGALNWLAAPEPAKVAAKASPKSKSFSSQVRQAGIAGTALRETPADTASSAEPHSVSEVEKAEVPSTGMLTLYEAETLLATVDRGVQSNVRGQQRGFHPAEVPSDKLSPTVEASRAGARASTVIAPADTASRQRPNRRHASNRPEKRQLALMTLRTIQFADGRRVTQLIPYRGRERALAFGADD